ncbi:ribosomal protein L1 [Stereum hirsutum FP-91666 SS1]|uniref:ribosomal protein L1 n=1 Tax=Stereum hirsutum (strain FP-91666) TaxID=721885 RepID=UPI000444A384|nr:ribosomal protein L1 [Stereum hirsutum FP-91666 SS1]EIM86129.1 ribosomal protein L1 [Stereum hirsutum FP-91666 SS1]
MAKAKTAVTKPTHSTSKAARMTASTKASAVPDTLIDSHVSNAQSELAFKALIAHAIKHSEKQAEKDLLAGGGTGGREDNVWLQVAVKTLYPEKKLKPHKIPLAHPLVDPRTTSVCLITKDPQREYKDLLAAQNINFISRVVGLEKLKGKFKPFEARRMLLNENGLFLADERVIPLLPKLLGKNFFNAKKQPIPVCLTRKDLKGELERAITATYMHQNQGSCTSVKIGTISQSPSQLLQNLQTALPHIVRSLRGPHTPHAPQHNKPKKRSSDPSAVAQTLLGSSQKGKDEQDGEEAPIDPWDNIQSLSVKTSKSMALPVWSCNLEDGGRWVGMPEPMSTSEEEGSESEEEAEVKVPPKKAGKKRAAEETEEVEKPAKKAKASAVKETESTATPSIPTKKAKKLKIDADPTPVSKSLATPASTSTPTPTSKAVTRSQSNAPIQSTVASGSEADVESAVPESSIVPEAVKAKKEKKGKKADKEKEKEKERKEVEEKAAVEDAAMEVEAEVPVSKEKKSKKGKKAVEADVVAVSEPVVEAETTSKKEKKGHSKKEAAAVATPAVVPAAAEAKGLTKEEMKQKREKGVVGEKKKEKVVKGQGSLASGEGRKGKKGVVGGK